MKGMHIQYVPLPIFMLDCFQGQSCRQSLLHYHLITICHYAAAAGAIMLSVEDKLDHIAELQCSNSYIKAELYIVLIASVRAEGQRTLPNMVGKQCSQ